MTLAHRRGTTRVTLTDATGARLSHVPVRVEQTRHAFGFGNTGFDFLDCAAHAIPGSPCEQRAQLFLDLFNAATLPFYWARFEPTLGAPDTQRLMTAARYLIDRGVTVKGHPLVWHTLAPEWLLPLDDTEVESAVRARITRDVTEFAGVIDLWDAINEVCILPRFEAELNAITRLAQSKGRIEMVRLAVATAREANPNARLVLNDFILTDEYEHLIEDCLAAGVRLDAIGVQTHMHQGFKGEDEIAHILERFGRFGVPVQMTETTLVSGDLMPSHIVDLNDYQPDHWPSTPEGEARQADEMVRHYTTVLESPSVESLTYWGFADAGSWLGAPSGFVRVDGSTKPSYDALLGLIKGDWWLSPTEMLSDADGVVTIEGFAGDYLVSGRGSKATVAVGRAVTTDTTVTL